MGKKLGLVKDTSVALAKGFGQGLVSNTAIGLGFYAVKGILSEEEVEMKDIVTAGVQAGLIGSAIQGLANVALNAGTIVDNYKIRTQEEVVIDIVESAIKEAEEE